MTILRKDLIVTRIILHPAYALFLLLTLMINSACSSFALPEFRPHASRRTYFENHSSKTLDEISERRSRITKRAEQKSDRRLSWPVPNYARFSQEYKPSARRPHLGIDLAAPTGTPIYAAHAGRVLFAGQKYNGYGKLIIVESKLGWSSFYSHCSKIHVEEGNWVNRGDMIGRIGSTGNASGPHLHFELRRQIAAVDPVKFLP